MVNYTTTRSEKGIAYLQRKEATAYKTFVDLHLQVAGAP